MRVLVTGGGGFVGGAVVRRLVAEGDEVRTFSRHAHPWLGGLPVTARRGDLGDPRQVHRLAEALEGCDAVVHAAARTGPWGRPLAFHRANVVGTRLLLAACRRAGTPRLVYVSSASVVHRGKDIEGGAEDLPRVRNSTSPYVRSKVVAETEVLRADGSSLATTSVRPHLVWGPGDPHFVPGILARARTGRLALVGDGSRRVDTTHVENAAGAIVAALRRLGPGAPCAGRAYFATDGSPRPIAEVFDGFLAAAGLPPVRRRVPVAAARGLAAALESFHRALLPGVEPLVTRLVVDQMATAHHFDLAAARRDLGWQPTVGVEEGLAQLAAAWAASDPTPPPRGVHGS